ncbi:ABC transporter substrate-binding protein [Campylobacter sp.]|uniref:ABC transporter substrate-binding protein n=1 Tax=Campylobacter sp. TaxID=205 RepID=UPI0025C153BC|nr:ABC transporter substrate-binding protein [Campylobacter sp.]
MKKIIVFLLLINTLFASIEVVDQLGRKVSIKDKVERIVVLQHQSLNVLVQLDATSKIVGILSSYEESLGKNYARLFPAIKDLPTPGDLKSVNLESLLALKPDLLIVTNYMDKEVIDKVSKLGIPVIAMSFYKNASSKINPEFKDFQNQVLAYDEGLYEGIALLGKICQKEENAKELINFIKNSQKILKEKVAKIDKNKVRLYVANPDFHTYGAGKYVNVMFSRAGGENVCEKEFKGFKQISPETLIYLNPSMIFVQHRYPNVIDELKSNKLISNLLAIKDNKIFYMPEYAKAWGYATPEAMAIGEFWVAKTLYPEYFKDFDLDSLVQTYYQKFYRTSYQK